MTKTGNLMVLAAVALVAGCGDDKEAAKPVAFEAGKVVFADDFEAKPNKNGWLLVDDLVSIEGGEYIWKETPEGGGDSLPDAMLALDMPAGVAASIDVEMTSGSALRGLTCRERELGTEGEREAWYELGIDGQRAQIRKMRAAEPPNVLKTADFATANGSNVKLTAHCVPDGDSLVLALSADGKEVVRTTDADPVTGAPGTVAVFGYGRPDSDGPADMVWDDFELRAATAG